MNLALNLAEVAVPCADRTAIKLDELELTYRELDTASAHAAELLRQLGVEPGHRVGLMLPNVPQFAILYYGILRAGGVVVPMNVQLKERETAFYLADSQAAVVFAWHEVAVPAEAGAAAAGAKCVVVEPGEFNLWLPAFSPDDPSVTPRADEDTAVILYTSGTTGTPKGAELTHGNLRANTEAAVELLQLTGEDDVILGALPLFHSFGQVCAMNASIAAGGCLTLIARFAPGKALSIIKRDGVTVFEGVPTMYNAMLNHPDRAAYDVSSLTLCASGGAALSVEVLKGFEACFGCTVLEGYGLSETSPVASFNHPHRERKAGSIGTPIAGVEMKLLEADNGVGEIAIRGHNVMKGYWQRPEATAAVIDGEGWFRTGDMATVDEDGYFFIVDRKKDMIIRGGYNVYPREIEEVLYEHPAVREAAVVGLPDEALGEEVGAAVALKAGADVTPGELREFVRNLVAAYKYPRHIWVVDELPKGPTGKILKRAIEIPVEVRA